MLCTGGVPGPGGWLVWGVAGPGGCLVWGVPGVRGVGVPGLGGCLVPSCTEADPSCEQNDKQM